MSFRDNDFRTIGLGNAISRVVCDITFCLLTRHVLPMPLARRKHPRRIRLMPVGDAVHKGPSLILELNPRVHSLSLLRVFQPHR
jgi:hypothetical protein